MPRPALTALHAWPGANARFDVAPRTWRPSTFAAPALWLGVPPRRLRGGLQCASCRSRIATLFVATVLALKFILTEFPVKLMFVGLKLLDESRVTPRIVGAFANTNTKPLNVPPP